MKLLVAFVVLLGMTVGISFDELFNQYADTDFHIDDLFNQYAAYDFHIDELFNQYAATDFHIDELFNQYAATDFHIDELEYKRMWFANFDPDGVCGNILNLVVWSAESGFKPTTFFFKALAVSDIVNIVSIALFVLHVPGVVSSVLAALSSTVSAHTTMAIAYARWLTVKQPTKVKKLLPKFRVIVSYVLLVTWCCLTWLPPFLTFKRYMRFDQRVAIAAMLHSTIAGTLNLVLPVIVTMCLNVGLIKKMHEHTHNYHLGQQEHRATRASRPSTLARSVTCVVCASVTTMLAYPLAFVIFEMNIYGECGVYEVLDHSNLKLLFKVSVLLVMLNASINVVYYLLFSSQFRQLLRRRLNCCVRRNDSPRVIPLNRIVV